MCDVLEDVERRSKVRRDLAAVRGWLNSSEPRYGDRATLAYEAIRRLSDWIDRPHRGDVVIMSGEWTEQTYRVEIVDGNGGLDTDVKISADDLLRLIGEQNRLAAEDDSDSYEVLTVVGSKVIATGDDGNGRVVGILLRDEWILSTGWVWWYSLEGVEV